MADNKTSITITAVDQTGAAIKSAQDNLDGLANKAGNASSKMSGFAALAGGSAFGPQFQNNVRNASFQIQDFAVQVNGGVDATKALAMQLPQLLGGFGVAGAALGVVASLLPNLVQAFSTSAENSKTFAATLTDLDKSIGEVGKTVREFEMDKLYEEFNKANSATRAAIVEQLNFQKTFIETSKLLAGKKFGESISGLGSFSTLDKLAGAFGSGGAEKLAKQLDISIETARDLLPILNGLKAGTEDVGLAFNRFGTKLALGNGSARDLAVTMGDLARSERDAAAASSAISEAQDKMATGHVQTKKEAEDAAKATKALNKEQAELTALLDSINGKAAGFDSTYVKNVETLLKAYDKGKLSLDDFNGAFGRLVAMQPAAKEAAKHQADYAKALSAALDPLEKQAAALEREVLYYGMTESAIQENIIARMEEARVIAEANGAWPEHLDYLDREIELRKRIAGAASQKEYLDTNRKAAAQATRDWEKFSDQLNQSLTDALYRSFESGKSFGQSFVEALRNTFKSTILKMAVQYTINAAGNVVGSLGNSALNYAFNTGAANGGGGVNYLGVANNASTAYGLASGTYLGYLQAAQAGAGLTSAEAAAAAQAYYSAGYYGTGASIQAGNLVAGGSAAGGGGSAAGASGSGSASGSSAGVSSVAWIAAIVAGMYMSSEAWRAGIRWEKYAKEDGSEYDLETYLRAQKDEPMRAIFGDGFVDSQFYAIMSGSALSAQIHYALKNALWGSTRQTGSQTSGVFSEATQGFLGSYGINMKKSGGLFSGSREWTDWYALPEKFDAVMDMLYRSVRNSFVMLGETFDDSTITQKLAAFTMRFNVATTDGAAVMEAAATQLSEAMGGILTPSVGQLKKDAETWNQAFQRILVETNAVMRAMEMMGDKISDVFGRNNLDGVLKASDAFVQLFGTVDAFNASFQGYYSNFYTGLEQSVQAWKDMDRLFANIGIDSMPTTRQQFRALVDAQDLNTESGRALFKSLMDIQGAFAALTPTLDDVAIAMRALRDTQAGQIATVLAAQRAQQQQAAAEALRAQIAGQTAAVALAQGTIDTFNSILGSLGEYRRSLLLTSGTLSPEAQLRAARAEYDQTATRAKLGDADAAGRLQSVSDALLAVSRTYGTADSYARDLGMVLGNVDVVMGVAERQIPLAQQQLTVAQQQLDVLNALLAASQQGGAPIAVNDFTAASNDWQNYFATTVIGQVSRYAFGTMQRISDSVGLFVDNLGQAFTFNAADTPYALASVSSAWRDEMIRRYGQYTVPAFASGGLHAGGLRLVGENGPELEFTGPSAIVGSGQSGILFDTWISMASELKALRSELSALRDEQRIGNATIASNTNKTARTLDKFDIDGMPDVRAA